MSRTSATAPRHIRLCADDYGIAPGVNDAIRELIARGRINATSVMTVAPHCDAAQARALLETAANNPAAQIGLHVTLTAPFHPLSEGFTPLRDGKFLPLAEMLRLAMTRRLHALSLANEIGRQIARFHALFGRGPDFLDGHQHVQLFPQIRDTFLDMAAAQTPNAWVRQCGRTFALTARLRDRKGLLLDVLSVRFRRKARRRGLRTNPAFAGTYDFRPGADFALLFPVFLDGLPDGGLVMCHPGHVDAELERLDPLTTLRQREYDYFQSQPFTDLLAAKSVSLT
jgi:predicted glycoside hydrolase/deacetylase ChbG (UPF0249 family)